MGSMGNRRGRRTRSATGRRESGWPTFRHSGWTYQGGIERAAAFARGRRLIRGRGGRRAISNRDLLLPIAVTMALLVAVVGVTGLILLAIF